MKRLAALHPLFDRLDLLTTWLEAGPLLLVRLALGQAFFQTGQGKWAHFERTVSFFSGLGIPFPTANAAFIASLELVGGVLLIVGLGTRVVSGLLAATMVVALLTAEREGFIDALLGRGEQGLTEITAFVYLLFLAVLLTRGAGALGVDRWVRRWLGRS